MLDSNNNNNNDATKIYWMLIIESNLFTSSHAVITYYHIVRINVMRYIIILTL